LLERPLPPALGGIEISDYDQQDHKPPQTGRKNERLLEQAGLR
jgi:hypothetical protein